MKRTSFIHANSRQNPYFNSFVSEHLLMGGGSTHSNTFGTKFENIHFFHLSLLLRGHL